VQVWTVGEGFGIGSEFRQTCCAANNFRDHDLDLVKAIWVHRAHRLLSELTRILCTLRNRPGGKGRRRLHQIAKWYQSRVADDERFECQCLDATPFSYLRPSSFAVFL